MTGFGLYLHVPYCRQLCPYCDFNVSVARGEPPWSALTRAMCAELQVRAPQFAGPVRSIYFGGGTPSLAPPHFFATMLAAVRERYAIEPDAEITVEVDPGTIGEPGLRALGELGVNRLSLGWQSTHDRLLVVLGRGHDAQQSEAAFRDARAAGFDNVSIDLILAVPGQTLDDLEADLARLAALGPEHVSLYALTYHEGTAFERRRARGTLTPLDEDLEIAMLDHVEAALPAMGLVRYEVSNYARAGRRAVHNSGYWQNVPYLGLGPGAHSYRPCGPDLAWRWETTRHPPRYLDAWSMPRTELPRAGDGTVEFVERLDREQLRLERFLCALRQVDGLDLDTLPPSAHDAALSEAVAKARARGWIIEEGSRIRPTPSGLRQADALAALF